MRLNQFEFIVALEACGSLSKAAEQLFISQPSISKAIKELEDEIGYDILRRTKTGVEFTEAGTQVLQLAKEIIERVEKIKNLQMTVDESICGKISLGATRFWGIDIFSLVVMGLKEQYPNVAIQFHEDFSDNIIDDVQNGLLDLGIFMMYSTDQEELLKNITESGLEYQMLFTDQVKLYANAQHNLHKKKEIYMKDVVQYPYVTGGNATVAKYIEHFLQSYGYQQEVEIISNQQMRLRYLITKDAFTSMPERAYQESSECQKALKLLPVQDLQWNCQVGVVYRGDTQNALQKVVLARLQEKIK